MGFAIDCTAVRRGRNSERSLPVIAERPRRSARTLAFDTIQTSPRRAPAPNMTSQAVRAAQAVSEFKALEKIWLRCAARAEAVTRK